MTMTKQIIEQLKEENEQLKQRISHLAREHTKLQNDLFSEQLLQDETDDYINKLKKKNDRLQKAHYNGWKEKDKVINKINEKNNKLKNELFNAYLEIESDNVNIQLSHYHIKKLLKIIDEHTLINPYTN